MAENKKGFVLYADIYKMVKKLPVDKVGELFLLILSYVNDENPSTDDLLLEIAFEPIKNQLKRDLEKWESIREKRSIAGKASAIKRQHMSTHVESDKQAPTNPTVRVNVNDNVSVKVKEKVIKQRRFTPPTLPQVIEYCTERKNSVDPSKFLNHYEANGWMRGKNKIKDWKACVRTWETNDISQQQTVNKPFNVKERYES